MTESNVQVQPDSTGKKVRTLEAVVLQADGSTATVEMQVISLADEDGNIITNFMAKDWQDEMLTETKRIRLGIQKLLQAFKVFDPLDLNKE